MSASKFPSTSLSRTPSATSLKVPYVTRQHQPRSPVTFLQSIAELIPRGTPGRVIVFIPQESEIPGQKEDYIYLQPPTSDHKVEIISLSGLRAILDPENAQLVFRSSTQNVLSLTPSPLPELAGYPIVKLGNYIPSLSVALPKDKSRDRAFPFANLFGRPSPDPLSSQDDRISVQAYHLTAPIDRNTIAPMILDATQSALHTSLPDRLDSQLRTELVSMQITFATNFNLLPFLPTAPPSTPSPSPSSSSPSLSTSPRLGSAKSPLYGIPSQFTSESSIDEMEFQWQDLCSRVEETVQDIEDSRDIVEQFEEGFSFVFYDRIFRPSPSDALHDSALSSRIAALHLLELDLSHLGVDDIPESSTGAVAAVVKDCGKVLQKLHLLYSPREKAQRLVEAHRIIVDGLKALYAPPSSETAIAEDEERKAPPAASADTLLPLLILSVLKSNPPQFVSNLLFVQRWRWREGGSGLGGEEGYCLINLMAVADFLENVDLDGLGLGGKGVDPSDLPPIPIRPPATPISSTTNTTTTSPSITSSTTISQFPLSLSAAKGVADKSGEVVEFIAGAGNKMFGAIRGFSIGSNLENQNPGDSEKVAGSDAGTEVFPGIIIPSDDSDEKKSQDPAFFVSPTLHNARQNAPWNAPRLTLPIPSNGSGDDAQEGVADPITPVLLSPSFGLLKKRPPSGVLSLASFGLPSFIGAPQQQHKKEEEMVHLNSPSPSSFQLPEDSEQTSATVDEGGGTRPPTIPIPIPKLSPDSTTDSRSIRSFESVFTEERESQKKGKLDRAESLSRRSVRDRLTQLSSIGSSDPDDGFITTTTGTGTNSPKSPAFSINRRFLSLESSSDLRVREIDELLREYQRLARAVQGLGVG